MTGRRNLNTKLRTADWQDENQETNFDRQKKSNFTTFEHNQRHKESTLKN